MNVGWRLSNFIQISLFGWSFCVSERAVTHSLICLPQYLRGTVRPSVNHVGILQTGQCNRDTENYVVGMWYL